MLFISGLTLVSPSIRNRIFSIRRAVKGRRIQIWRVAVLMIKDHPLLGVGNGNFIKHYKKYRMKKRDNPGKRKDKPFDSSAYRKNPVADRR